MGTFILRFIFPLFLIYSCGRQYSTESIYKSDTLEILRLTDHSYIHISYLQTEQFGKVACNGMILVDKGEAVVLETTTDEASSHELIQWIKQQLEAKIKAVIVHHFHEDCLGGMKTFHREGITSLGTARTIELARASGYTPPLQPIGDVYHILLGGQKLSSHYFGPAHTEDNIVSFFRADQLLFGGCMIKSMKSGQGNTEDANLKLYASSVRKLQQHFAGVEIVVPGHGQAGGPELIRHTIELFSGD